MKRICERGIRCWSCDRSHDCWPDKQKPVKKAEDVMVSEIDAISDIADELLNIIK